MFTIEERERLRDELVAQAHADSRITGAALTGSAAAGREDEWSDIDLAFGLAPGASQADVIADWTDRMYRDHGVVHHTDMTRRGTIYRVFLLANTLQVDIAFAPAAEFGAYAPTCLRHGFTTAHGRSLHLLPEATTAPFTDTLIRSLASEELTRAFRAAAAVLLTEIDHVDPNLALSLSVPLQELSGRG